MSCFTYRHRPAKYRRVCQCCEQEIKAKEQTHFNHLYTLLCKVCFDRHLTGTLVVVSPMAAVSLR